MQEVYAELLFCVQSCAGDTMCLVRPMELPSSLGQSVCNEFDCPLLYADQKVMVVPAGSVFFFSVSVVCASSQLCVLLFSYASVQLIDK